MRNCRLIGKTWSPESPKRARHCAAGRSRNFRRPSSSVAAEVKNDQDAKSPPAESEDRAGARDDCSAKHVAEHGWNLRHRPVLEPLATGGLVFFLVVLMLLQWADLRSRLVGLLTSNVTGATHALDDAAPANRALSRHATSAEFLVRTRRGDRPVFPGRSLMRPCGDCARRLFRYVPYAGPAVAAALSARGQSCYFRRVDAVPGRRGASDGIRTAQR